MVGAVRGSDDAGIAHHPLFADLWGEPYTSHGVPMDGILTIDEPQTVSGWLMKRGGHIPFLGARLQQADTKDGKYKKGDFSHDVHYLIKDENKNTLSSSLKNQR